MKKKGIGSEARADLMDKADADMELLNHAEQERQLLKQKRRRNQGREGDVCICSFMHETFCDAVYLLLWIVKRQFLHDVVFSAIYDAFMLGFNIIVINSAYCCLSFLEVCNFLMLRNLE